VITAVLVVVVLGAGSTIAAVLAGSFRSSTEQRLAAFLIVGCAGVACLAILGLLKVTWSSLLYEHLQRLSIESDFEAPATIAQAAFGVWYSPEFTEQVILATLRGASAELRVSEVQVRKIAAEMAHVRQVQEEMATVYCDTIAAQTGEPELVKEMKLAASA
jgi:hypothetical protein